MSITKSIIESFELKDGAEVYVQSGALTDVSLSFDNNTHGYTQRLTFGEAQTLANRLIQVIKEVQENGKA